MLTSHLRWISATVLGLASLGCTPSEATDADATALARFVTELETAIRPAEPVGSLVYLRSLPGKCSVGGVRGDERFAVVPAGEEGEQPRLAGIEIEASCGSEWSVVEGGTGPGERIRAWEPILQQPFVLLQCPESGIDLALVSAAGGFHIAARSPLRTRPLALRFRTAGAWSTFDGEARWSFAPRIALPRSYSQAQLAEATWLVRAAPLADSPEEGVELSITLL
ncbi:MAG: hypothetical protein AAFU73_17880 [Planctomycetota bacterium]